MQYKKIEVTLPNYFTITHKYLYLYEKTPSECFTDAQTFVLNRVISSFKILPAPDIRFTITKENFSEFEYLSLLSAIQNGKPFCSYPGAITKADGNTIVGDKYCLSPLVLLYGIRDDMRNKSYKRTATEFMDIVNKHLEKYVVTVSYNKIQD